MMVLIFKELIPFLMLVIALVQIGLEYKWCDKRTKKHKNWRITLIVLLVCSAIATMTIIKIDHNKAGMIESKINNIPKNFEEILRKLNRENYKEYYEQAKFNYEAGMFYQLLRKNVEAAKAFLLFRDIALKTGELQAAALSSLIAAYRFQDINDFTKAAELQSEAGDLFIKLNRVDEAILWKRKAVENYETAGVSGRAENIKKEIEQLK